MDRVAAAAGERAVLAELRAIGLSLAASTGVLRPVQAREVRGLAKRLVGSTDLLGQVFRWEGEDYLVNDIAPGPTQSGGQAMKAYEAARLLRSLRPGAERREGEAEPCVGESGH